jgi:post-segregation antitoxin (ccd killing protein)
MDEPEKVRVEVELDRELVELAATAGLDLADVADRALQRALGAERLSTVPRYAARLEQRRKGIEPEVARYNAQIEREGIFRAGEMDERNASDEEARRWEERNAEAIRESNEELRRNGLWSDGYRLF